uniref:NADH-ubiquinone oxidoreductase chain 4L n=1 Tax=Staphylinoidea sp. 14 KM-2017 TaxID=2219454 RepID=A0A346RJ30_9COLE|nr:NADH dehydrogenase subunit 4L [Staphylinoidea sp. 14 KM-2017]
MFLFLMMYLSGIISFCMNRKHFLLMLLSLEFVVVSLFMGVYIFLNMFTYEYYFSMIFLTLSVCEGVLGLSLLISLIRTHGSDYFQVFNILW